MTQKTIDDVAGVLPTKKQMQAIDGNFDELYTTTAATTAVITLTEYADNAAAVSGGLAVGDWYSTTGTVKVVTA